MAPLSQSWSLVDECVVWDACLYYFWVNWPCLEWAKPSDYHNIKPFIINTPKQWFRKWRENANHLPADVIVQTKQFTVVGAVLDSWLVLSGASRLSHAVSVICLTLSKADHRQVTQSGPGELGLWVCLSQLIFLSAHPLNWSTRLTRLYLKNVLLENAPFGWVVNCSQIADESITRQTARFNGGPSSSPWWGSDGAARSFRSRTPPMVFSFPAWAGLVLSPHAG